MPPSITAAQFDGPPTMRNEVRFVEVREEPGGEPRLVLTWSVNPEATHVAFSVERSPDLKEWQDEGEVVPEGSLGNTVAPSPSTGTRRSTGPCG